MSEWTNEEILQQAQLNALAGYLGTVAYFKRNGQSIEDWATFLGEQFASGWDGIKGADALDIARAAAFNPVSVGGTLVSLEGDAKQATAVFDVQIEEIDERYGVSIDEYEHMVATVYRAIFTYLGINFISKHNGERWTYELSY